LYDSDQYGHEIAFSNDGASLFARTYDVEDRTPLKQFVISSGIIRTIWQDCIGLAKGRSSVYFVGNRNGKTALYEIDKSMATPRILPDIFPFDSLLSSGTRRMIISTNSRRNNIAVFDSMSHKLTTIDSRCENAAAYDNHKIFCSREGNLYLVNSR